MTPVLKALGALLTYPSPELVAAMPEINALVAGETRLPTGLKAELGTFAAELASGDLLDLQERYVGLFDRGRRTSLHLFEHVHGDSRDRGQAMVDLKDVYARAGLVLAPGELPDYLPVVLEYLAQRPFADTLDMIGDCAHIVRSIGEALARDGSPYAAIAKALLALVGAAGLARGSAAVEVAEPPLDDEWREEPVFFGPPGGCGASTPSSIVHFVPRRP
jgi:nitrate reductase delta subunit